MLNVWRYVFDWFLEFEYLFDENIITDNCINDGNVFQEEKELERIKEKEEKERERIREKEEKERKRVEEKNEKERQRAEEKAERDKQKAEKEVRHVLFNYIGNCNYKKSACCKR